MCLAPILVTLSTAELLIDAGLVKAPCGSKKSSRTRPISEVAAVN
jgi:hypothetical protein